MSDQHKPTAGECYYKRHNAHSLPHAYLVWKGDKPLAGPMQEKAAKESCDAINAALDAERGELVELHNLVKINDQLRSQLDAEREKYEAACEGRDQFKAQLSDADKQLRKGSSLEASHQTFNELVHDNQQLREQLAAEREKWQQSADAAWRIHKAELAAERESYQLLEQHAKRENQQLREQLVTERERADMLEGALHHPDDPNHTCLFKEQLAAEREKALAELEGFMKKQADDYDRDMQDCHRKLSEKTQQLAAERYERLCDQKNHKRELAAEREKVAEAQAAKVYLMIKLGFKDDELPHSTLDAYVAEKVQTLVEALNAARQRIIDLSGVDFAESTSVAQIDAALAKIGEK